MNFKKAGIFRRSSEGSEQPEVQNDSGGMLAVWGSPGSGKTVTAVKIAKMLSARKKNVILLLCDMTAPTLVDICLRFNPDILVVGEMRGAEANAAQEATRVGVAVLTTIHSNSCEATYRRMVSLCKRAVDMSDETLLSYVTEAYPIVVFCKQLENKQCRMMEIMECEILPNGDRRYNTLFRYIITETTWRTANSSSKDITRR